MLAACVSSGSFAGPPLRRSCGNAEDQRGVRADAEERRQLPVRHRHRQPAGLIRRIGNAEANTWREQSRSLDDRPRLHGDELSTVSGLYGGFCEWRSNQAAHRLLAKGRLRISTEM